MKNKILKSYCELCPPPKSLEDIIVNGIDRIVKKLCILQKYQLKENNEVEEIYPVRKIIYSMSDVRTSKSRSLSTRVSSRTSSFASFISVKNNEVQSVKKLSISSSIMNSIWNKSSENKLNRSYIKPVDPNLRYANVFLYDNNIKIFEIMKMSSENEVEAIIVKLPDGRTITFDVIDYKK